MLNFRRLKHDFPSAILKEGKELFDKGGVVSAKIISLDSNTIRMSARVRGNFQNIYESEIEIDRGESEAIDSNCDCTYNFDCQHLAAFLFYLEKHLDAMLAQFSKETDLDADEQIDEQERKQLKETLKEAVSKENIRKDKHYQQELLKEYTSSAEMLGRSPFFLPEQTHVEDKAELAVIFAHQSTHLVDNKSHAEIQLALRLPLRSKPLHVIDIKEFIESVRYREPLWISGKRYFFTMDSFEEGMRDILHLIVDHARFLEKTDDRGQRVAHVDMMTLGRMLAQAYDIAIQRLGVAGYGVKEAERLPMPCLYNNSLEEPLCFSTMPATLRFELEYLQHPAQKIFLKPLVIVSGDEISPDQTLLFSCVQPGLIYQNTYYRLHENITRQHLLNLSAIRDMTIPEPLFGTFIENALPEMLKIAEVSNREQLNQFVTFPFVGQVEARCDIQYLDGELEASLFFIYDGVEVPAAGSQLKFPHITQFVTDQGVFARSLVEERAIIDDLFQGFIYDADTGNFVAKTEKKIVEFMTEVIPRHQHRAKFNCPENLLDQFIYDDSSFEMHFRESKRVDVYEVELKVNGYLKGVSLDHLWESISAKKTFIEIEKGGSSKGKRSVKSSTAKTHKILVLNLEKITPMVQLFDEIGIKELNNYSQDRPLWSLANLHAANFEGLPVKVTMTDKLLEIQQQLLGIKTFAPSPLPKQIQCTLRNYQQEGVYWLERLRVMHLNGILADDMGLGKTLQAIIALTQYIEKNKKSISLIVCPTSLVYNWKEEFTKFNKHLDVLVVDGIPAQRKKLLDQSKDYHIIVTSYSLLQKDIELYEQMQFGYVILDEAQHIKNRGTRNAKSVKLVKASHRLILTGTPIENSLEELWSLFDFLMPGLLSTYERFMEKYVRNSGHTQGKNLESLSKKVAPFILRRMKKDVLQDLPPVSEIVYHCHLSKVQRELYQSYAASAREELSRLVKKEGFDKVQIHVLATLTRLKQICCHPAIFAKENAEEGDSAKYDMLIDLLQSLVEGQHKTVIFSQYTRMLNIMRQDLQQLGIPFAYLDGSSKNRLQIVKSFNEDPKILVFLVSLKAGGTGLNLVGADTVIHYDMWWNPAVENQATDRVHRLGQQRSVSSYKLITMGTIEEKILQLQERKRNLVTKVVSCDDEAVAKLTWEEVLELLQT